MASREDRPWAGSCQQIDSPNEKVLSPRGSVYWHAPVSPAATPVAGFPQRRRPPSAAPPSSYDYWEECRRPVSVSGNRPCRDRV
jgi:hypothetical protein